MMVQYRTQAVAPDSRYNKDNGATVKPMIQVVQRTRVARAEEDAVMVKAGGGVIIIITSEIEITFWGSVTMIIRKL